MKLPSMALAIRIFAMASVSAAEIYEPVSAGSIYVCGQFDDGTTALYTNSTGTLVPISSKAALKRVSSLQSFIRQKIQRINEFRREISRNQFSPRDLAAFARLIGEINKKGIDDIQPLPPGKAERLESLDTIIANLKLKLALTKSEIRGIKDCASGKPPKFNGTFTATVVTVQSGIETVVGALVTTAAKDGKTNWSLRWFCVRLPNFTGNAARLFSTNPCVNGGLAVSNCSSLVPEGRIGYIEPFTTYGSTPSEDSLNDAINRANEKLSTGPTTGRVRGKNGANGTDATDDDRCDD